MMDNIRGHQMMGWFSTFSGSIILTLGEVNEHLLPLLFGGLLIVVGVFAIWKSELTAPKSYKSRMRNDVNRYICGCQKAEPQKEVE